MSGHRLEVVFARRRGSETVFVCSATPEGERFTLPQAWTDRDTEPIATRDAAAACVSVETLCALRDLTRQIDLG